MDYESQKPRLNANFGLFVKVAYTYICVILFRTIIGVCCMKDLYQEKLMDCYRSFRNRGSLENPTFASGTYNPSCGDAIAMQGYIVDGRVTEVRFEGHGCIMSQGTASMLCDHVVGMPQKDILSLNEQDMRTLVGIDMGPTRLKCAMLPLQVLQEGIKRVG